MAIKQIKIDQIQQPNWSFKNPDKELYQSLYYSVKKNGQTKNIIVRHLEGDKYEIIDGRKIYQICQHLEVDYIYCYVYRDVSKTQAMLLYLQHEFNFENNFVEIAAALKRINKKHSKFEISKFSQYTYKEVEELLNLANYDFSKFQVQNGSEQEKFF